VEARNESSKTNNIQGLATSIMHLGVAEIFRKNFLSAEKYLRQALTMFENIQSEVGLGWCNLWLGQNLYSQNRYEESRSHIGTALVYLDKLNLWEGQGKAWAWIGFLYAATGEYDSSFYYLSKSLLIRKKMSDDVCVSAALTNMGHLYKEAGDNEDALDYYRQGLNYANSHNINMRILNWNYFDEPLGIIHRLMNQPDSSLYYLQRAVQIDPSNIMTRIGLGETYLMQKRYDSALNIFLPPIEHFRTQNDRWDLMRTLLDAAKAYEGKKDHISALHYVKESFAIAENANVKQYMMRGYELLSKIYNNLNENDSAYFFLQKFTEIKDVVMNKQFMFLLSNYKIKSELKKQQDEVAQLNNDNRIKEQQLKYASNIKWLLIGVLFILILSGFFIYRNLRLKTKNEKLQNQKMQSELKLKATELEVQALRAQMNPHFIFNCLSSINRFILKNETEAASDYLTKFSRLIRTVLTNSNKAFISLEDELEMLKLFLDMERLRFKNTFDYSINFTNSIDTANVFIPPMLLQPFAENAIWHGLMHKQEPGKIEIAFSLEDKILTCIISDNGVGRSKAEIFKSKSAEKQKSMGMKMTKDRLALLNRDIHEDTFLNVEDILDREGNVSGTRVILKMNYKNLMEACA
jgi:tetratricopeptide (TPR) repeat protein